MAGARATTCEVNSSDMITPTWTAICCIRSCAMSLRISSNVGRTAQAVGSEKGKRQVLYRMPELLDAPIVSSWKEKKTLKRSAAMVWSQPPTRAVQNALVARIHCGTSRPGSNSDSRMTAGL